jgi:adenosylmethionine---8-amino-7-oxononanoate aminotransferase
MKQVSKSNVWHPFTQHGAEPTALAIESAHGAWLTTRDGRRVLDAISSWWVITHGHTHPQIVAAIQRQASSLDQIIFAGFTHEPAERVARQLVEITPDGLDHVFFSDSGSTAVEVALKMALGYWRNLGENRSRILALEHAYHGDTIGTMSAGARGVFNAPYAPLLFDVGRIPFPSEGCVQTALDVLEAECRSGQIAAFICEPLVLGAGGMVFYSATTLAAMHAICRRHNVLFIADEVMTGFGRTGTLLACTQADITPDILCLAKGLTGGALPLAVTMASAAIFDAHVSKDRARMFFHSSSYTANPIACAAADANLNIWRTEPILERIALLERVQAENLRRLSVAANVREIRQIGTITAIDVAAPKTGYLAENALTMRAAALARGILLRPLGNTLYVMPPYCTTAAEISHIYDVILEIVGEAST